MIRGLIDNARTISKPNRVRCRVCAVIDNITKIPYDGSMVFIKWRLNMGGILSRFRSDEYSGMTQALVVRNGSVNFRHPFVADCWLRPPGLDLVKDHLVLTVHRLKSGSEIENVGEVTIALIGDQQPVSQSSYLVKKSNANAIIQLTLSIDVLDLVQDAGIPRRTSPDLCMQHFLTTPQISVKSLKARSISTSPTTKALSEIAKQENKPKHKHNLSTTDVQIICKLLDDLVTNDDSG